MLLYFVFCDFWCVWFEYFVPPTQNNFLRQLTILSSKSTWLHNVQHYTNIELDEDEWELSALLQKHNYTTSFFGFLILKLFWKNCWKHFPEFSPGLFGEKNFSLSGFFDAMTPAKRLSKWIEEVLFLGFFKKVRYRTKCKKNLLTIKKTNSSSKLYENRKNWCFVEKNFFLLKVGHHT